MGDIFKVLSLIDGFLLRGIFVSVIIILVAKLVLRNTISIGLSLNIIRITLIIHSVVYIILFITSLLNNSTDNIFWTRALGPYWWAYWIMMTFNSLLPLTLLIRRLGNNNIYLLSISILMNIGWIFESFVTYITNMEREYLNSDYNPYLPTSAEISVLINGLILGIFILLIGNLITMKKNKKLIKGK